MENPGQNIADDLRNTLNFSKQRKAVSDAIDSAGKSISGVVSKAKSMLPGSSEPVSTYKYDDKAIAPKPKAPAAPKTIPSYKHGTSYVPKTGPAKLHKGEAVIPKHEASKMRDSMSGAAEELGGTSSKPAKVIKHITTKKAKTGGYIHEHHHTHPEHHPMEEHVSPNQDAMMSHMMEHMGEANPGEADADAGQSGIPGMGSPTPSGGPTAGM